MAKESGLGQQIYVGGYDLSGDVGVINNAACPRALFEVTAINKSAVERVNGRADGLIDFNSWFNDAALAEHPALKTLPTTDVLVLWATGGSVGDPAMALTAKQANYDGSRGADGSLAFNVAASVNGVAPEWGEMLTSGQDTHASASSSASKDDGTQADAVTITSSSVANPTNILTAAVHGLTSGDTILIAGHTGSTPALDGYHTVTVVDTTNFTIPVNVTVGGNGGTMTLTSTRNGLGAQLQIIDIASGTPTITIQDSQDNSSWATLISFTAVADGAEPSAERKTVAGVVDRFLRVTSTGTFTDCDHVIAYRRGEDVDDTAYA